MSRFNAESPVALFSYNRPEKTKQVLSIISKANPPKLFLICDGDPKGEESSRTNEVRDVLSTAEDNFQDVSRNYADYNLGLKERFSTGLDWVFSNVDKAIILEDDTVPQRGFFQFCDYILEEYEGDDRVMEVTGRNQLGKWRNGVQDYHFSYNGGIWGWGTWSDAWEKYDPEMRIWEDEAAKRCIEDLVVDQSQYNHLHDQFEETYNDMKDTWDYQWAFVRMINSGLSVVPSKNLIENTGFERSATNTKKKTGFSRANSYELSPPIKDPTCIVVDREYDRKMHELRPKYWKNHPYIHPIYSRLRKLLRN